MHQALTDHLALLSWCISKYAYSVLPLRWWNELPLAARTTVCLYMMVEDLPLHEIFKLALLFPAWVLHPRLILALVCDLLNLVFIDGDIYKVTAKCCEYFFCLFFKHSVGINSLRKFKIISLPFLT